MHKFSNRKARLYLMYAFLGFVIASPLPNEFADVIMAGMRKVKIWILALLSFILSFIGIIVLLWV